MFFVRWVTRGNEVMPIESEDFPMESAQTVVAICLDRLAAMRAKYPDDPPDGFIVIGASGNEIARWFDRTTHRR